MRPLVLRPPKRGQSMEEPFSYEQKNLIYPGAYLKKSFPIRPSSDNVPTTGHFLGSTGAGSEVPSFRHTLCSVFFGTVRCEGLLLEHRGCAWKLLLSVWGIAFYRVVPQVITDTAIFPMASVRLHKKKSPRPPKPSHICSCRPTNL